jgi:hypothetical protein
MSSIPSNFHGLTSEQHKDQIQRRIESIEEAKNLQKELFEKYTPNVPTSKEEDKFDKGMNSPFLSLEEMPDLLPPPVNPEIKKLERSNSMPGKKNIFESLRKSYSPVSGVTSKRLRKSTSSIFSFTKEDKNKKDDDKK